MIRHILVVDDDFQIATLFQDFLEASGYRVSIAHEGVSALSIYDADPADAVITDLAMPRMGGSELIRHLRLRTPSLPVIVVSGYPSEDYIDSLNTVVFMKPVKLAQLVHQLQELLAEA
ncbi:response regulator receiver domain-containing protein [Pseudomonas duriflava]|uniref:Response regulator receiver domain-containing protein n=1 Tax=Pseudomonas duriflava TaxID=459528 RepID=A0A562QDY7_9PSED|nr:response regulator [Pseudomonas duriflava]TWI54967.1 response regulator receiver domain-containing protein [Pseudomonas duriflava]